MSMNLLIVTQKLDQEDENLGAFYPWFEELAKRFDKIVIIASSVGKYSLPSNVEVCSLGKEKGVNRFGRIWNFWKLFSQHYVASDAVFFHQIPEFVLAAAPFLLSLKRTSAFWYAHGTVTRRLRLAERLVDHILTSSSEGFRVPSKKVSYVGQAIDLDCFKPLDRPASKTLRMISSGRISPIKDYDTIIRACKKLQESWDRPWNLSIIGGPLRAGDKSYFSQLKNLVNDFGLSSQIQFLGPRPFSEIPELLNQNDIFINLSSTGSLDKAVLQAMASGLSVLTSNEAYRSILPAQNFLEKRNSDFLAERIRILAEESRPNLALRQVVINHHALQDTMDRISARLFTPV